ncbi:MAG: sugar transferase [Lachnospiraceae bacterium]|nr:sugar transferase [Lachnospiraceae bacterium]
MKSKGINKYKNLLNFIANAVTLVIEGGLFAHIWYAYYVPQMFAPFFKRGNWGVITLYILFCYFFTRVFNGYKIAYLKISDMAISHILAIGISGVGGYLVTVLASVQYMDPKPLLFASLADVALIIPWIYIVRKLYDSLYPAEELLVIFGDYTPRYMIEKINKKVNRYKICGQISLDSGMEVVKSQIDSYGTVLLYDLPDEERNELLKYCYNNGVRTYTTPKLTDVLYKASEDIHLFDSPLYLINTEGLSVLQLFVKRVFDIVVSLLSLVILLPFMLITGLIIWAYDKGPVLYRQIRLTRGGKKFYIYKFRSMRVDAEKDGQRLASKNDDRITPFGKLIRRIHFDEVPQLFNILHGEMSFVGPRPETDVIHAEYLKTIPEYDYRLKVKAGLTGYAQVYGQYNSTPYDKLKLDLAYIENYSIILDIKIMLLTLKVLFIRENSEGVEEGQRTAERQNNQR